MAATTDEKFRDLVCGADITPSEEAWMISYDGAYFHFCSRSCLDAFEKDPTRYVKPKGFFVRFLERLARANQREFSRRGQGCSH